MQCAKTLEWDKLIKFLSLECETVAARHLVAEIDWQVGADESKMLLRETAEADLLFRKNAFPSLTRLPQLTEALARAQSGATLSIGELLNFKTLFELSRRVKASVDLLEAEHFPEIAKFGRTLNAQEKLVAAISHDLEDDGRVKDDASQELGNLRREQVRLEARIKDDLAKLIHSSTISKALQEPIFTQRNGRYVVPVIASSRGAVPGIVHDTSVSGMTVFIEPAGIIEDANRTRMVALEIEREVEKILSALSEKVHVEFESIEANYKTVIALDLIFARARFGTKYNGIIPALLESPGFNLLTAKHPLLILQKKVDQVIGNDVRLGNHEESPNGAPVNTLVVTGPNTGGKTVLLKTVGLLVLMLKAGLMLPVAKGSSAFLFDDVFADIGDEQSLEQSLSTFSSHLTNIIEIVERAREGSLVLLDEIGAGTDPREGSALAQATLEHLNRSGALTLITTHVSELKMLAYAQSGFANASFEFDAEHFRPTYKFKLGIPGASQAAKIAKRLGLEQSIIERTENLLDNTKSDLDDLIKNLEDRLAGAIEREDEAAKRENQARDLAKALESKLESLEAQGQRAKSELATKITSEFEATQSQIKEITARLQKEPSLAKARLAQEQLAELRQELGWLSENKEAEKTALSFKEGDLVFVGALNQRGRVERVAREADGDKPASLEVRVGSLKLVVPSQDLKPLSGQEASQAQRSSAARKYESLKTGGDATRRGGRSRAHQPIPSVAVFVKTDGNTLDLRGARVENALSLLDNFLDNALLSGISPLMIIHGHGTGALKQAVRDQLTRTNYQIDFRPGESYEGGDGVTMVSLK
jgi:DNA mismatch repair protein MutS2